MRITGHRQGSPGQRGGWCLGPQSHECSSLAGKWTWVALLASGRMERPKHHLAGRADARRLDVEHEISGLLLVLCGIDSLGLSKRVA